MSTDDTQTKDDAEFKLRTSEPSRSELPRAWNTDPSQILTSPGSSRVKERGVKAIIYQDPTVLSEIPTKWRMQSSDGVSTTPPSAKACSIIGLPFWGGQPLPGVDEGPSALREAGLVNAIESLGWKVSDQDLDVEAIRQRLTNSSKDIKTEGEKLNAKNSRFVGEVCREAAKLVAQHAKKGEFCLNVGGDHSLAIGTIAGLLEVYPELRVIWIDAHADINSPATSPSGNIHGMPVAFLMDVDKTKTFPGFEWLKNVPKLDPSRICFIGLRDVDAGERKLLRQMGIKVFTMYEVDKLGIGAVMKSAMNHVDPHGTNKLHLSFDIDGLDPSIASATGTRAMGGLSFREGRYICENMFKSGRLVSMDLVELNPSLSDEEGLRKTVVTSLHMIEAACGWTLI